MYDKTCKIYCKFWEKSAFNAIKLILVVPGMFCFFSHVSCLTGNTGKKKRLVKPLLK